VEDIQALLSVCFADGLSTLTCAVMLGHFGLNPPAKVSTGDIAPHDLHLPIIFSLAEYMHQLSLAAGSAASFSAQRKQELNAQLSGLRSGAGAFFRRSAIAAANRKRAEAADEYASLDAVQQIAAKRAAALFREMERLPLFRDGVEVSR